MPKAREAAKKALRLDETLGEAHTLMAAISFWYDYDQAEAEREFQRAIERRQAFRNSAIGFGYIIATVALAKHLTGLSLD